MKGKNSITPQPLSSNDLLAAVESFIAKGGIIQTVSQAQSCCMSVKETITPYNADGEKVEQLKSLLARGAGFSSLQYSLKMNRQEIRQLAQENGLKIPWRRPIVDHGGQSQNSSKDLDRLAGEIMHQASLDLTLAEIAEALNITLTLARSIVREYRIAVANTPSEG